MDVTRSPIRPTFDDPQRDRECIEHESDVSRKRLRMIDELPDHATRPGQLRKQERQTRTGKPSTLFAQSRIRIEEIPQGPTDTGSRLLKREQADFVARRRRAELA